MKRQAERSASAFVAALSMMFAFAAGDIRPAIAQDWPNRMVKVIVVGGAGGGGDILARLVAEHLSSTFKQNFVVENRVGAGGTIGSQAISSSTPDGYTVGTPLLSSLSLATAINPAVPYDPSAGFTHIAYIAGAPVVLAATPKTNVKTLPEFVSYAGSNHFTYATAGVGTDGHLAGELIAGNLKVKSEHVPYKSAAQGISDVVAGHVPFSTFNIGSATAFLRSGQVNGVAVTSRQRLPDYPDLPTFTELGHPNVVMTTWYPAVGTAEHAGRDCRQAQPRGSQVCRDTRDATAVPPRRAGDRGHVACRIEGVRRVGERAVEAVDRERQFAAEIARLSSPASASRGRRGAPNSPTRG